MKQQFLQILKSTSIFFVLFYTVSCISTQSLIIEIPIPSQKELPDHIQSLTLVNRTVDEQTTNLEKDTLQKIFYKSNFNIDTIIYDLQSIDTTLKALGDLLFESGRYDIVIPEERFLAFEKNAFLTKEMDWSEVKEICETFNTDAVLSLDHFKTRISTDYKKESFFDQIRDGFASASVAHMTVYYEALFRIYDPAEQKIVVREFLRDTLYWEDYGPSARQLFEYFTPVKRALTEAGIAVALDFSDIIGTHWREERRNYFAKGNSDFKQAGLFIEKGETETALTVWKKAANEAKSKSLKSKAQFNVALAYELLGEIDDAIKWALESYNTMYRIISYEYLEMLQRRKNEIKKQEK